MNCLAQEANLLMRDNGIRYSFACADFDFGLVPCTTDGPLK